MDGSSEAGTSTASGPWALMGRDTPAGRALYNLYTSNKAGKEAGTSYSMNNRRAHERRLSQGWSPKGPPDPSLDRPQHNKAQVSVPKPQKRPHSGTAAVDRLPHRRPAEAIKREMEEEQQRCWSSPGPLPTGPLLDANEKERLAMMMQYRGKPPSTQLQAKRGIGTSAARRSTGDHAAAQTAAGPGPNSSAGRPGAQSEMQRLKARFAEVSGEVKEREEFLAALGAAGRLSGGHAAAVKAEVAARLAEMRQLDVRLAAVEADMAAGA